MHPQRPLPLHRRLNRPLMRSVFCRPAASEAMPPPQAVRRRTTVTRAPRSRARLISATNSRRFVAKPRTPHPITRKGYATSVRQQSCQRLCNPQAAQLFKCRSANVRGRGARPLVLSLGGLRGILSFEKESIPLYPCSAKRCSPRGTSAAASFALVRKREKRKQKAPAGSARAFCCVVCVFLGGRKSHRGEFPFASIKIPVNLG